MKELEQEVISWRRHLHENPELSFCEAKTTAFIEEVLKNLKCFTIEKPAKTGLVAFFKAKNSTYKTIAFRADIDALKVEEKSGLSFASKTKGFMHACGHDAHTAILLGLAKKISEEQDLLKKNVKLIFQRGEEIAPGGAKELVDLGVLKNVEMIFALHLMPGRKSGSISIKRGIASANKDSFEIFIEGKGGHSSAPQNCIDPILIASNVVLSTHTIVSRNINPFDSVVVSFTQIKSGNEFGIIPQNAYLSGTIRSFDDKAREKAKQRLVLLSENISRAYGGEGKVKFALDYRAINNDEIICKKLENIVKNKFGEENLIQDKLPQSFSEDFSEYQKEVKGVMVWLGVGENAPSLHSDNFNPDEKAFMNGVEFFYEIIKEYAHEE